MERTLYSRKTYVLSASLSVSLMVYLFSTTRLVPSPTASAATEAVTDSLAPLTSTTTEAAEAAGADTGGTIFVVTIVPIFTGEPFKIKFFSCILLNFFLLILHYFTVALPVFLIAKAQRRVPPSRAHCKGNPICVFPEKELRGLSPNFHIHVSVSDLYIPRTGLIWNLCLPVLRERTLGSTTGAERRAGNCCQAGVGSSSLPSSPLLQLSQEFTLTINVPVVFMALYVMVLRGATSL
jgi:hypothetical protein